MSATRNRKAAEQKGRRAEFLAEVVLMLKGYRVLARRVKLPVGEVDLICAKGRQLVFIEVKFRKTLEDGKNAVPLRNWQRIARASDLWSAKRGDDIYNRDRRYDLFVVNHQYRFCHIRDAWRPDYALTHD